ncbi:hypothetical protein N0V90_004190 [Kalmusia sp. IMI 367209]|nr:hypothetical protein N0V90_004190 [Kalmusia sp. IMI 367209]
MAKMDSLTDAEACTRDAALMSRLGINTVYVDSLDPSANHDDCFSIFNSVGIYIALVLRTNFFRDEGSVDDGYTTEGMKETFKWIDAVKDYENLLSIDVGFFPGPEYMPASRFAKAQKIFRAFIRDTKEYIALNMPRKILVGASLTTPNDWFDFRMTDSVEYLSCVIPTAKQSSSADFVGFIDYKFYEYEPLASQLISFTELARQMENATVPTFFSSYASLAQNGEPEFEVFNETVQETGLLYNTSNELVMPYGPLAGGARFEWTNVRIMNGMTTNPGLTVLSSDGDLQLTSNYDVLHDILAEHNTESWLNGENSAISSRNDRPECAKDLVVNATIKYDSSTITLATDWDLPTRPPGLDDIITSGAHGTRGQMVDVIVTTIEHEVRDSKGEVISDLTLSPTKSEARSTTLRSTSTANASIPTSSANLSTGAKAGIGVGASLAGVLALAGAGIFLFRRRRQRNHAALNETKGSSNDSDTSDVMRKAELATGPDVEANIAELPPGEMATPKEVPGDGYLGISAQTRTEPAELPTRERAQEMPAAQSPR